MKHTFENCYEEATVMYTHGYDNKYIEFQLSDKGVSDEMIDEVIVAIKNLRKSVKKRIGVKQVAFGLSFIAVALLFTFISFGKDSPVVYVLWGLAVTGVLATMKGVANILNLL
ncbi:hypothetical protein BH10BAC1_BH10BAC1_17520 [soil metagenome]